MSLPYLYDIPEDREDWDGWSFNHAAIHYDLFAAIQRNPRFTGAEQFSLYPLDQSNIGIWLYYHQVMHNQANVIAGTTGFNLLQLDLKDPDSVAAWMQLNGDEHVRLSTALRVG